MKLTDFISKDTIIADLQSTDKKSVLEELALPVAEITQIAHKDVVRVLIERESLGSTGIGNGIGIPHGKLKNLKTLVLGMGVSRKGVNFDSMDGKPAYLFFLLLTPDNSTDLHLKLLARISKILKNEPFKEKMMHASNSEEILEFLSDIDEEF